MFSRISCFLCALIVSRGVWVQASISVVERPQGINVAAGKHSIKLELVDQKDDVVDRSGYHPATCEISVVK